MREAINELLKRLLRQTPLHRPLRRWLVRRRHRAELAAWDRAGRPLPLPHLLKQRILRACARQYGLTVLVETGTYYGGMIDALGDAFERVYSIELDESLFTKAKRYFDGVGHIELIHGDSGRELERLLPRLDRAALFWLDAHHSGGVTARGTKDTPILEELQHILPFMDRGHVIVIDDARCFGADPAYPTIDEIRRRVESSSPGADMVVEDDTIRITPKSP